MKKISVVDKIIILLLAALMIFGVYKFVNIIISEQSKKEVSFKVISTYVEEGVGDVISEGDDVTISLSEKEHATVKGVKEKEHYVENYNPAKGEYDYQAIEGKSDIELTLSCEAGLVDGKIVSGDVAIRVGEAVYIHGKGYGLLGYIVDVDDSELGEDK